MNQMTEPSTYERPAWPINALPKHWIEALFSKMSAFYGAKFAAMWSGSKPEEVQKAWALELFKLSREQLKAGSDALTAFSKPPTLPEFVAHCKQARLEMAASTVPRLENLPKMSPEEAEKNLVQVRKAVSTANRPEPGAEWAFRLLITGRKDLPYGVVRTASDAITSPAGQKVINGCIDPDLKAEYTTIRQAIVDDYRMRGFRLWETK